VEGSGAVQPRLTAGGDTQPHYDVVAEESSLDNTFEDAEDEVIKFIRFTLLVGCYKTKKFHCIN